MAAAQPGQHHPRGEDLGYGVGDALPGYIGGGTVGRLEDAVTIADVGRGRHTHPADSSCGQVRNDVPEHIFCNDNVVPRGVA